MFRRLEPISRSPSPNSRRRSRIAAFPHLVHPIDTSDEEVDQDDDESARGGTPPVPQTSETPPADSKRKRKAKRMSNASTRYKKRKLQLEEEQIQKALERTDEDNDQGEMLDTIRVRGGILLRGFGTTQSRSTTTQGSGAAKKTSGGHNSAAPTGKSRKASQKPSTTKGGNSSEPKGALRQTTLSTKSFSKGSIGNQDESDTSSLSSLSELENEMCVGAIIVKDKSAATASQHPSVGPPQLLCQDLFEEKGGGSEDGLNDAEISEQAAIQDQEKQIMPSRIESEPRSNTPPESVPETDQSFIKSPMRELEIRMSTEPCSQFISEAESTPDQQGANEKGSGVVKSALRDLARELASNGPQTQTVINNKKALDVDLRKRHQDPVLAEGTESRREIAIADVDTDIEDVKPTVGELPKLDTATPTMIEHSPGMAKSTDRTLQPVNTTIVSTRHINSLQSAQQQISPGISNTRISWDPEMCPSPIEVN